jgi:hypothetical protein
MRHAGVGPCRRRQAAELRQLNELILDLQVFFAARRTKVKAHVCTQRVETTVVENQLGVRISAGSCQRALPRRNSRRVTGVAESGVERIFGRSFKCRMLAGLGKE